MMKKYLLIFLVLFSANMVIAQYGWTEVELHLKNGKVLNGEAKLTMMSAGINMGKEKLKFRDKNKKNKSKHLPEEVDFAVFTINYKEKIDGEKFERTRIEKYIPVYINQRQTRMGFVELMVDGKLKLVGRTVSVQTGGGFMPATGAPNSAPIYQPGFMGIHNQVMILREGEKPEVFNQVSLLKSFKNRAMDYFEDCPVLKTKLENKDFVKEDLQDIVKFYNSNCN